ncbi:MAG: glycosyltransferase family 2 protein [Rariglobus sp.]|nr:glycosyltransferase family 2 protein [Rariglobus sp.]
MTSHPSLALVVPIYNEAQVLPELLRRLDALFAAHAEITWTVVFVNDGSRDNSVEIVMTHAARDPRYKLVDLSRNFGHQAALTAGLFHAGAHDAVITMDADLQDPPEVIPDMIAAWKNGAEVVLASRRSRQEKGLRRMGFDLFHRCFGKLTDFPIESNTGTFGLLSASAVSAFNSLPEKHRFFPGMRAWIGFRRGEVLYDRQKRAAGEPVVTFRKLVRYALDGVFSFSHLPLRLLTYIGLFIAGCGFAVGAFFVTRRLLGLEVAFTGFTTLVTLMLFLGGIQLIGIGILGEYLGRIYDEVKHRPHYIVRRRIGLE